MTPEKKIRLTKEDIERVYYDSMGERLAECFMPVGDLMDKFRKKLNKAINEKLEENEAGKEE